MREARETSILAAQHKKNIATIYPEILFFNYKDMYIIRDITYNNHLKSSFRSVSCHLLKNKEVNC